MKLTKRQVLSFLSKYKLMTIATYGNFPWIASVFYAFDKELNIYFISNPRTLHAKQILQNSKVAISIADSSQKYSDLKKGLQLYGIAEEVKGLTKLKFALKLWKQSVGVIDPNLTSEGIAGSLFRITPKRVKLFDQRVFNVKSGLEPVLEIK